MADPLGGSWYVEALTDELERRAEDVFAHLDDLGAGSMLEGVHVALDEGWFQGEIADAAYELERKVNDGRRVVVGVNRFTEGDEGGLDLLQISAEQEAAQIKRLQAVKADRDSGAVATALDRLGAEAADPEVNLMPALIDAVSTYATEGEIIDALAAVFGRHTETPYL